MPREKDPTWQWVQEHEGKLKCNFCGYSFSATITRMKAHLGKIPCNDIKICTDVPDSVVGAIRSSLSTRKKAKGSSITSASGVHYSPYSQSGQPNIDTMLPPPGARNTIFSMVRKKEKEIADKSLVATLVDACIPFNVLRNKFFIKALEDIAAHGLGYKAPSYETARANILGNLKEDAENYVKEVKKKWESTGCTIMSDGWTDKRNRPHINLLVVSPHGTVFLRSVCATGKKNDARFLADFISSAIDEEIGAENVVQVIADNAANYSAAGVILETRYPHIFKTNCAARCIDLMLEDIDKIQYVKPVLENARKIVKFLYRYQHVYDLMKKFTTGAELKRPGATRFATQFLCLQSVLKHKEALRFLVASNEWRGLSQTKNDEGVEVSQIIQGSIFWSVGKEIVDAVEPLVKVLRMVDGEGSTICYLYEAMDRAKEPIKSIFRDILEKYEPFWKIIDERWNNLLHSPLHAATAFLNLQLLYDDRVKLDQEVRVGYRVVVMRLMPHDKSKLFAEMTRYASKVDDTFDDMAIECLQTIHPRGWWDVFGHNLPYTRQLALRILGHPCSASACERNWSAFEAVHTKKQNRLEPQKLHDLVYVKLNLHLQKTSKEKHQSNLLPIYIDHIVGYPEGEKDPLEVEDDRATDDDDAEDRDGDGDGDEDEDFFGLTDLE